MRDNGFGRKQRDFNTSFWYGIPKDEVKSVCRSIYANEMVKLTVQIADPTVMVIEKDVSATFTDHLGVVGKKYMYRVTTELGQNLPLTLI